MVFLFRSGTIREKLKLVYKATRQHARNLATFAVIYKTCMLLLRVMNPDGRGKEGPYDTFFSGLVGGYFVFGRGKAANSSVNQQIVIYVFARVVLALAKLSIESPAMTSTTPTPTLWTQRLDPKTKATIQANAWPVFASLSWAMVMYIFRRKLSQPLEAGVDSRYQLWSCGAVEFSGRFLHPSYASIVLTRCSMQSDQPESIQNSLKSSMKYM